MSSRLYQRPDGSTVPSVSTVLALVKTDYRSAQMDAAAERGTNVHAMIAADLRDEDAPGPQDEAAGRGFAAWLAWRFSREIVAEAVEAALVGPWYGGTVDLVGIIDGARCVVDHKVVTTRDFNHYAQIGAYSMLWNHLHPDRPVQRGLILRLDVKTGQPDEYWLDGPRLVAAGEYFAGLLGAYVARERLKSSEREMRKGAA